MLISFDLAMPEFSFGWRLVAYLVLENMFEYSKLDFVTLDPTLSPLRDLYILVEEITLW